MESDSLDDCIAKSMGSGKRLVEEAFYLLRKLEKKERQFEIGREITSKTSKSF